MPTNHGNGYTLEPDAPETTAGSDYTHVSRVPVKFSGTGKRMTVW